MDREEVAHHIVDSAVAIHESAWARISGVRRAQLLTYLKLSGHSIGFLLNWKVTRIKHGIQRMIRQRR